MYFNYCSVTMNANEMQKVLIAKLYIHESVTIYCGYSTVIVQP